MELLPSFFAFISSVQLPCSFFFCNNTANRELWTKVSEIQIVDLGKFGDKHNGRGGYMGSHLLSPWRSDYTNYRHKLRAGRCGPFCIRTQHARELFTSA